ncbi:putative surface protein with fasciclin (FAS1) repeats [Pontibacter aydingkolensis]|uniref:hypothetical protein n=1 Tax=Pontibacter aydingkolensis TaxID=1911536 RepID=UPI001FE90801|nr:hypothetical protein [Pontibacter aydingkolensis]
MKKVSLAVLVAAGAVLASCNPTDQQAGTTSELQQEESFAPEASASQSAVQDDESQKNVVQVAASSPDHTTLVTAV